MTDSIVQAPNHLGESSRAEFRERALSALAKLQQSPGGRLIVDLSGTERLDSAGLGTLVMLQMRAADQRCCVVLCGPSEEIRFLLLMTRLEDRFIIEASAQG
ncbi:MAG: STAS domain-containing protein [Gemmatimonadales bacterium]